MTEGRESVEEGRSTTKMLPDVTRMFFMIFLPCARTSNHKIPRNLPT